MEQSRSPQAGAWIVRSARLIDVPAVARLLGDPTPAQWRNRTGLPDQTLTSATRLVLTHVALELGAFWVAVDAGNRVLAAVVLLPPGHRRDQILDVALRVELDLLPRALPQPVTLDDVPEQHWLLLPAASQDDEEILRSLLDAAMPAIDLDGRPVLSLQSGPPPRVLFEVGFRSLPASTPVNGSASLRPGAQKPVKV
jgi:hypothetical protein